MKDRICVHDHKDDVIGPVSGWIVRVSAHCSDHVGPFKSVDAARAWFGEWFPPAAEPEGWTDEPVRQIRACIVPVFMRRPVEKAILKAQKEDEKKEDD
jgi:hypothetical protein